MSAYLYIILILVLIIILVILGNYNKLITLLNRVKKITLILLELHTPKMLSIGFCRSMHAN